jgi:RNA polymerase sigma-70 factor (sigma-E family)
VADFSPTLLRAAVLLLGDRGAAEDAVQTALLRTYSRWRTARRAPQAYSRRVLVNLCHDHRRYERRHPPPAAIDDQSVDVAVSEPFERVAEREALARALDQLPVQQREVVVLRFYLDLSVVETAEVLGVPQGTVKSAAHRGLLALRDHVDIENDQGVPSA